MGTLERYSMERTMLNDPFEPLVFHPGLPSTTGAGRQFPKLKRRTKDSPPKPWDRAAMEAYFGQKARAAHDVRSHESRAPRRIDVLRAMEVDETRCFRGAGDRGQQSIISATAHQASRGGGKRFMTHRVPGVGVWVTRVK